MKNLLSLGLGLGLGTTLLLSACGNGADNPDNGTPDAGVSCTAARAQLIGAIDAVASGNVTVISNMSGVTSLYVDATAGGSANASKSAWSFVNLETGTKVPVTDTSSTTSTAWDLAFKRPVLYTNSGDGGPGQGGAALIAKDFANVTAADATGVTLTSEKFFDAQCNPQLDQMQAVLTTFSDWYDYNDMTHTLSPAAGTWIVRGGTGKLYKLAIMTYYSNPDGTTGTTSGAYSLKVGAL